jgi:alpha-beta hydrolase superfamily lysophospholipase
MLRALIILSLLLILPSTAIAQSSSRNFYTATAREIAQKPGTLIRYQRVKLPALYRAKAWRILYTTRDFAGRPIASSGYVVLPDKAPEREQDRHIIAWAHPTTGVARACAPTLRDTPRRAILGLNEIVAAGHIVAGTDYPGLGTSGPVGYLVGKGQAQAVIDSVRAARQLPGVGGSPRYALWGYSQGGHAVAYATLIARNYAPELNLQGVAAVAPPSDMKTLILADGDSVAGHVLASFTLGSWSAKYQVPLDALLRPESIRAIRRINANCIDDLESQFKILKAQSKLGDGFQPARALATPPWNQLIAVNSLSGLSAAAPALIIQGGADGIVRPAVTRQFVRNSCHNGARVKYVELQGLGHTKSAPAAAAMAINWLSDRLAGKPAPSSCR